MHKHTCDVAVTSLRVRSKLVRCVFARGVLLTQRSSAEVNDAASDTGE
jgi:hypothetical protein